MSSLHGAMRQTLAEMTLISYGKTQAFNASGSRGENSDPRPSGEAHPLVDHWTQEWARCPTHDTLEQARAELHAWKVRQAPVIDTWDEQKAILDDGQGYEADLVARRFQRTPSYIRKLRLSEGRDSEHGFPYDRPAVRLTDADARIRNLASQGCTERQIAFQVGVSKTTVRRALGRAA